jgi:hypothetical protein
LATTTPVIDSGNASSQRTRSPNARVASRWRSRSGADNSTIE